MGIITLRVLDGADRGKVFEDLPTPVTIGREEGNVVQLNDERVSRYHLKIQEDDRRLVLTDLESTNGTKVNGETAQLWLLRPGDLIVLGRTMLLFGSEEEISERIATLKGVDLSAGVPLGPADAENGGEESPIDFGAEWADDSAALEMLHTLLPPELPEDLSPGQAAQLSEVLQYLHLKLRGVLQSVKIRGKGDRVQLDLEQWQGLIDLQTRLARYLRAMGEPE